MGASLHSPHAFRRYVDEHAVEVLQIDPTTNGGITASLALVDEAGLKTSSHYTDELSAHLLCASEPSVHLEKQAVIDGHVRPTETPGTGMHFNRQALEPHRVA